MRNLIALFVCSFVIATASANDPPAGHGAASASASAAAEAAPVSIKPKLQPPLSPAAQRAKEDEAEAELSAKIAARLAVMRANQAARANAAAKAKKAAEIKQKDVHLVAADVPPPPTHGTHWSYEGEGGPANWSKINSDWAKCGTGTRQSPIDIRDGMKVDLEQIVFDYKPSSFSVIDNGHTIQVNLSGGNYITIQNRSYELMQFHFHRPSEERVNGKGFEMVAHLVHKDAEGKLAVVAVLLERGKAHSMIQTVWNNLPLEKNDTVTPSVVLDVNELLPKHREYFTYMGSLTTPPCSEGVLWLVLKEPMQAAPAQMALFSRLYPLNARPIQPSSGRVIKESN
ncbi:MAG: carbonic anhydrase family protein [Pseudomonadota bacterium]